MRLTSATTLTLATLVVLFGMAANSLLARAALMNHLVGPALFTAIRLASGALVLILLSAMRGLRLRHPSLTAVFLLVYAAAFSYTYVVLGAAMGALLLFFAVQATMLAVGMQRGERVTGLQMVGAAVALTGLYVLVGMRLHRPPLGDVAGMLAAGCAWGLYSMWNGRGTPALAQTTANFVYAAIAAVALLAWSRAAGHGQSATWEGIGWAMLSGSVTSSLIYLLWYAIVPRLATAVAATVQLAVPLLVAAGAWLWLAEPLTWHLVIATILLLSGIAITTIKAQPARPLAGR
ncbi:MAG: DMT family transporter [Gammaproteobacteria bacterium]|nr:DMT family transporter [Gammaproteobacteria bacterium]